MSPAARARDASDADDAPTRALKRHKTDEDAVIAAGGRRIAPTGIGHGCLHDVVRPRGDATASAATRDEGKIEVPEVPAKAYAFELDAFQRAATCECLERDGSRCWSRAHTSAGKTVVAEYAIAMAIRDGQRVVYTSPLKALSNQKYRELKRGVRATSG